DNLKTADAVVEGEYGVATICHQCLESHGLVAEWGQDGTLTVWASTQAVTGTAQALSAYFRNQKPPVDLPINKVKCITHYMGGGTVGPLPYGYPFENKRKHVAVRLNAGQQRAMRAPGHPQSCYLTDCALDDLAAKLGLDPMQVRLKNLPPNDEQAVKNAPTSL